MPSSTCPLPQISFDLQRIGFQQPARRQALDFTRPPGGEPCGGDRQRFGSQYAPTKGKKSTKSCSHSYWKRRRSKGKETHYGVSGGFNGTTPGRGPILINSDPRSCSASSGFGEQVGGTIEGRGTWTFSAPFLFTGQKPVSASAVANALTALPPRVRGQAPVGLHSLRTISRRNL